MWFEHVTLGTVAVSPDAAEARDAVERARQTAALMAGWTGPGATSDGHPVSILANFQDGSAARAARGNAACRFRCRARWGLGSSEAGVTDSERSDA